MKKVAILARRGIFFNSSIPTHQTIGKMMGQNTGNLLFWNSISSLIEDESITIMDRDKFPPMGMINKSFDVLVIPLANHLSIQILNPGFVNFLRKVEIPILVLGIGAQISIEDNIEKYIENFLSESYCREFISILNDKCTAVCARGLSSLKVLKESGYKGEIYSTGCPSQTISPNPKLGEEIKNNLGILKEDKVPLKVVHNLANFHKNNLTELDVHISRITKEVPTIKIQQSGSNLVFERFNGTIFDEFRFCNKHDKPEIQQQVDYLFTNCESWAAVVSRFTFSIGTRLHGNQMPLQLGIPCLTIAHDVRVEETCEQMGVPYCQGDTLLSFKDIWNAIEKTDDVFDAKKFDQVRIKNCKKIRQAILKSGLKPSGKLEKLSESLNTVH